MGELVVRLRHSCLRVSLHDRSARRFGAAKPKQVIFVHQKWVSLMIIVSETRPNPPPRIAMSVSGGQG
jgi:hypothetical protein